MSMTTSSGPQTPPRSLPPSVPVPATPFPTPPSTTAAPKRKSSELGSEAPDSSGSAQRPLKLRKLRKHHVLAFADEDDSDADKLASVAEDGTHIKREPEPEQPSPPTPRSALRAEVAAKLEGMRVTKTHILSGIQARIAAFQGARASCREAEAGLDVARRRLNSFDALIEEVQRVREGLERPKMERLLGGGRRTGGRTPMVLFREEVGVVVERMEAVRETKLETWRGWYQRVKEGRREVERLGKILDRRWEVLGAWTEKMEALEGLETVLASEIVAELLE